MRQMNEIDRKHDDDGQLRYMELYAKKQKMLSIVKRSMDEKKALYKMIKRTPVLDIETLGDVL